MFAFAILLPAASAVESCSAGGAQCSSGSDEAALLQKELHVEQHTVETEEDEPTGKWKQMEETRKALMADLEHKPEHEEMVDAIKLYTEHPEEYVKHKFW